MSSLSFWDWLDVAALVMVFFGVLFGHVAKKNKSPREDLWEAILIIGLGVELGTVPHTLFEVSKLKRGTEELRARNLKLEEKLQPRTLTQEQRIKITELSP